MRWHCCSWLRSRPGWLPNKGATPRLPAARSRCLRCSAETCQPRRTLQSVWAAARGRSLISWCTSRCATTCSERLAPPRRSSPTSSSVTAVRETDTRMQMRPRLRGRSPHWAPMSLRASQSCPPPRPSSTRPPVRTMTPFLKRATRGSIWTPTSRSWSSGTAATRASRPRSAAAAATSAGCSTRAPT